MNLVVALVADARELDRRLRGGERRDSNAAWRVEEGKTGGVQQDGRAGRACGAEDSATLAAVLSEGNDEHGARQDKVAEGCTYMPALKDGELLAAEEGVAAGSLGVGLYVATEIRLDKCCVMSEISQ